MTERGNYDDWKDEPDNELTTSLESALGCDHTPLLESSRKVLFEEVQKKLNRIIGELDKDQVFAYYEYEHADIFQNVLVINDTEIAGKGNLIVLSNKYYELYSDTQVPDDKKIELLDLVIPKSRVNSLNYEVGSVHIIDQQLKPEVPDTGTLIEVLDEEISLLGNIWSYSDIPSFVPEKITEHDSIDDIYSDIDVLFGAYHALRLCDRSSYQPEITYIEYGN